MAIKYSTYLSFLDPQIFASRAAKRKPTRWNQTMVINELWTDNCCGIIEAKLKVALPMFLVVCDYTNYGEPG
jgi:hypothetical protein